MDVAFLIGVVAAAQCPKIMKALDKVVVQARPPDELVTRDRHGKSSSRRHGALRRMDSRRVTDDETRSSWDDAGRCACDLHASVVALLRPIRLPQFSLSTVEKVEDDTCEERRNAEVVVG